MLAVAAKTVVAPAAPGPETIVNTIEADAIVEPAGIDVVSNASSARTVFDRVCSCGPS